MDQSNIIKDFESFITIEENLNVLNKINANPMEQSVYTKKSFPELSDTMCMDISAEFRREIKVNELLAVICDIAPALNGWRKTDGGLIFTKTDLYYVGNTEKESFSIAYENISYVDFDKFTDDPEHVLLKDGSLNYERLAEDARLYNLFMQEADPGKMVDENDNGGGLLSGIWGMSVGGDRKNINTYDKRKNNLLCVLTLEKTFSKHELEARVKAQNGWGKIYDRLVLTNKENKKFYIPGKRFHVRAMYNFFMDYLEYMATE